MDKLLTILGIGYKQLSQKGQEALAASEVVLGSRRLLEVFALYPEYEKAKGKLRRIDSVDLERKVRKVRDLKLCVWCNDRVVWKVIPSVQTSIG